jgi:hypothetical protein
MTDSECEIDSHGTKRWFNDEGQLHRLDGPAKEWCNGSKSWWVNGKLYRLDGPAIEWSDGTKHWFIADQRLTQRQFKQHPLVIFYRLCQELV